MLRSLICIPVVMASLWATTSVAQAATQEDFQKAFAAAQAANKEAAARKNQWTTTAKALADAKKDADLGKFEDAVKLANEAESLAKASIAQSERESKDWQRALIR